MCCGMHSETQRFSAVISSRDVLLEFGQNDWNRYCGPGNRGIHVVMALTQQLGAVQKGEKKKGSKMKFGIGRHRFLF